MNSKKSSLAISAVGVLGALAVVGFVVSRVSSAVKPADINEPRRLERLKFRDEVAHATTGTLTNAAVIDADRGTYRIPLESAKEIVLREWKTPSDGRKALLERLDKATAKLPETVSDFE
jgi:hypothetical protein